MDIFVNSLAVRLLYQHIQLMWTLNTRLSYSSSVYGHRNNSQVKTRMGGILSYNMRNITTCCRIMSQFSSSGSSSSSSLRSSSIMTASTPLSRTNPIKLQCPYPQTHQGSLLVLTELRGNYEVHVRSISAWDFRCVGRTLFFFENDVHGDLGCVRSSHVWLWDKQEFASGSKCLSGGPSLERTMSSITAVEIISPNATLSN